VLSAAWPDVPVTVLNEGIGGQTVDEVMPRLETDVLAMRPTLVIWQTGANEMLRGIDPARFAARLDEGVRRILDSGADVVLMDNQVAPRLLEDQQAIYDGVTAKEAQDRRVSLFSRTRLMREWRAVEPAVDNMIGPDGLHHTDRGYACLAGALGQAMIDATAPSIPLASVKKK
jgi:acyl-CoA thioesterase I